MNKDKKSINGWIVQYISRKTTVVNRRGTIFNTESKIKRLTSNNVLASNKNYTEFFLVRNGNIVDRKQTYDIYDKFQGGAIRKYDENNQTMIKEKYDTSGDIIMESKAYFINKNSTIDKKVKSIGENIEAANGLISSKGIKDYKCLERCRNSNIWCSKIRISWKIPNKNTSDSDAGLNKFTCKEYKCKEEYKCQ
jgi:hypothetical protein